MVHAFKDGTSHFDTSQDTSYSLELSNEITEQQLQDALYLSNTTFYFNYRRLNSIGHPGDFVRTAWPHGHVLHDRREHPRVSRGRPRGG